MSSRGRRALPLPMSFCATPSPMSMVAAPSVLCAADNVVQVTLHLRRGYTISLARYQEMSPEQRRDAVDAASRRILERNWVASPGFTMPNRRKYPWQWLWDSCFHAIAWSSSGRSAGCHGVGERALSAAAQWFRSAHGLSDQTPSARSRCGMSPGRSDITQPPMYGHALRVLAERGFAVEHLCDAATAGLNYLFEASSGSRLRSDPRAPSLGDGLR